MTSLSLCMIVKDEEDFLEQCLNSIKDYVDEIIIVDTGSTDRTIEIAKKFTDKVYQHKWPNDFSKARNISLGYATKEWILVLDADEIIDEEDFRKIRELIKQDSADGFVLNQRNYTNNSILIGWISCFKENKYTKDFRGYMPSKLVRLFRNKGFKFKNKVHELIEDSIKEKEGKIANTDIQIHHYSEYRTKKIKKIKEKKYFRLGEEQIKENPNQARAYYEKGIRLMVQNKYEKAINNFKEVIKLDSDYRNIYYNLASAYHSLNKLNEAENNLKRSVEKKPKLDSAYNLLGIIYQKQERYQEAIDILFKGIKINRSGLLLQTLGGLYVKLEIFDKAVKALKMALKMNPNNLGALINLGGAYVGLKQYDNAIIILKKIISIDNKNFDVHKNLAFVYLKNNEKNKAIEQLNRMIEMFPEQKGSIKNYIDSLKNQLSN
ncbi:tetratricopeptide repeat protein [Candidatus Woesearchaeota archaeon]|nr:tetratricopeptide repeat protein [Candidatus Woesearchaeota archaeon]